MLSRRNNNAKHVWKISLETKYNSYWDNFAVQLNRKNFALPTNNIIAKVVLALTAFRTGRRIIKPKRYKNAEC